MTDISEIVLLPMLLNRLRAEAPGVRIEVDKITGESPRRLEDGEVDLAVGFMPQLEAGFYQQKLFAQNFVCIASTSHPRINARVTTAAFAREGHVVVSASGTGHTIVDKVFAQAGVQRKVALLLPSFLGLASIVAQTELISTVPSHYGAVLQAQGNIRALSLPHPLPDYDVKQHWHQRYHSDSGNVWLRRTVGELMTGLMRRKKS
jgi:DNA-binding transcriptional LysR family regulator